MSREDNNLASKERILHMVDQELTNLVEEHKQEVDQYERQLRQMSEEILKLQEENERIRVIERTTKQQKTDLASDQSFERFKPFITHNVIDQWIEASSEEDGRFIIEVCKKFWIKGDIEMVTTIFRKLARRPYSLFHNDHEIEESIQFLMEQTLVDDEMLEVVNDALVWEFFNLIIHLHEAPYRDKISYFIFDHADSLTENIYYMNEPSIMVIYLRALMTYDLKDLLKASLHHLIDVEWEYIEDVIKKKDVAFLFWYSYLFGMEEAFINTVSLEWYFPKEEENEIKLFRLLERPVKLSEEDIEGYINRLRSLLNVKETTLLKEKLNNVSENSFAWPHTELTEDSTSKEHSLNEKSALKELGYQISGLTPSSRWEILQKAVPELGLRRVVMTISYNIKLRKDQKNGAVTYQRAIAEWEHDLAKLKECYYQKDFTWPNP
ncbi:hypothetical protein N780_05860 [Pontibacillus chungwhensis BH030062]|uniref:Uncharacterized protein n=1 Tax=Pontibacillus chungwhensis BH030062 TaxID=1385513 RepID=A0A0A2V9C2_9BACI|nr:hypothetical protein [Pontibacillus chungwhensis]KGP90295.1 hypothetical protein N780_05860 [Pontibacillus chungwhensis BH030062]